MDPAVYRLFSLACPYLIAWLLFFLALTIATLIRRAYRHEEQVHRDSLIGGELPGLPLVLMHSVAFAYSCLLGDWLSMLVFGWWGPGFLVVAILVLSRRRVDWRRVALGTSVGCKLNYLILVGLFFHHDQLMPVFAYSLWIMHDQVRLAWLQFNADRTRRVVEDWWLPRICYPLFLTIPLFDERFPWRWICVAAGGVVMALWVWGLVRLVRRGIFTRRPRSFTDNLRDIVYLTQEPKGG